MGNVGYGSNVDVNHLLSQIEELKRKVVVNEEKVCLYKEQIMELKKMLAKEEHQSQASYEVVVELRKKIAKQHTKIYIERKIVKVLGCIEVFLWGLLSVVTIAFAMK